MLTRVLHFVPILSHINQIHFSPNSFSRRSNFIFFLIYVLVFQVVLWFSHTKRCIRLSSLPPIHAHLFLLELSKYLSDNKDKAIKTTDFII